MTKSEFEDSLIDVRKAYRLIFLYQQRVLDLMQFIGREFKFRYSGGETWWSDPTPGKGKGKLENSSWDWLNMYFYLFNFTSKNINIKKISFAIALQSDTGFFDTDSKTYTDTSSFQSPEKSQTKLIFIIGQNCFYNDYAVEFEDQKPLFKEMGKPLIKKDGERILLAKSFYLSDFINIESTRTSLRNWSTFCNENGILDFGDL